MGLVFAKNASKKFSRLGTFKQRVSVFVHAIFCTPVINRTDFKLKTLMSLRDKTIRTSLVSGSTEEEFYLSVEPVAEFIDPVRELYPALKQG
jgi:hypothetical protein